MNTLNGVSWDLRGMTEEDAAKPATKPNSNGQTQERFTISTPEYRNRYIPIHSHPTGVIHATALPTIVCMCLFVDALLFVAATSVLFDIEER